jgi:hypothetical protein
MEAIMFHNKKKIQGEGKEEVKDDLIEFHIVHCHFHLSQFELKVLH